MVEKKIIPDYKFDKAEVIVSFGADFLGNWLSPVEFSKGYISKRKLDAGQKEMSRHIQIETAMSLTGSNADERIQIRPSEEKVIIANLYVELLKLSGKSSGISSFVTAGTITQSSPWCQLTGVATL